MFNHDANPTVTNCSFSGNMAANGGGMRNTGTSPTVTHSTFSGNMASFTGGGMENNFGSPMITNLIFWGNVDDADAGGPFTDESAQINVAGGTPVVNFSDVQSEWPWAGGTGNLDADPLFVDADGVSNMVGTDDDDLHLSSGSPCIDAGSNAAVPASLTTDLDGATRASGTTSVQ